MSEEQRVEELARPTSTEIIEVDGDLPRDQVLALGKFQYMSWAIRDGTFPLDREGQFGQWKIQPKLTQVGYCKNTAEALRKLKEKGIRPLTLREFIFWMVKNQDRASEKFIGVLGVQGKDLGDVRCSACFDGSCGYWDLHLSEVDGEWDEGWWSVGVPENA